MSTIASSVRASAGSAPEVSVIRLYLLRAGYLLLVVGLGSTVWPSVIHHAPWTLWHGVGQSMLAALSLLAVLGLRYPLKMLPLLFFEMAWKAIWLVAIALPLWMAHSIDADTADTIQACLVAIVFPIVIPWRYVFAHYVLEPGDRWR